MNTQVTKRDERPAIGTQVDRMQSQYQAALPPHIPLERFVRVVKTAIGNNPDLQNADQTSLLAASVLAAQDGLLPDGRDGAFVVYNTKVKRDGKEVWIKKAQWMPMIGGILKKIRNSGELRSITAQIVYAGDTFRHWIDETGEHLQYEAGDTQDQSMIRRAFAMALTKDGGVYIEVMTAQEIDQVRNVSKASGSGPWRDWYGEMAKKTVLRRLAKRLPMSSDLDDLVRNDDALYDFEGARQSSQQQQRQVTTGLAARLSGRGGQGFDPKLIERETDAFAGVDPETGEIQDEGDADTGSEGGEESEQPESTQNPGTEKARAEGYKHGYQKRAKAPARDLSPSEEKAYHEGYAEGRSRKGTEEAEEAAAADKGES